MRVVHDTIGIPTVEREFTFNHFAIKCLSKNTDMVAVGERFDVTAPYGKTRKNALCHYPRKEWSPTRS
jgi:hypothetical protein